MFGKASRRGAVVAIALCLLLAVGAQAVFGEILLADVEVETGYIDLVLNGNVVVTNEVNVDCEVVSAEINAATDTLVVTISIVGDNGGTCTIVVNDLENIGTVTARVAGGVPDPGIVDVTITAGDVILPPPNPNVVDLQFVVIATQDITTPTEVQISFDYNMGPPS
ncbi:MAG: hypothetical protein ABDH61_02045 [Acidilobaceae archaeon]